MSSMKKSASSGSLTSATNYAEKWNQASEKKLQFTFEELDAQQIITASKITREMKEVEKELNKIQKIKPSPKSKARRSSVPVIQTSIKSSTSTSEDSASSSGDEENTDPQKKKKIRSDRATYATRSKEGRIDNLHRRYSAQLNSDAGIDVAKMRNSIRKGR